MIPLILEITMIVTFNGYAQSIDVNRMDAAYYCSLLQYGNDNDAKKAFDFSLFNPAFMIACEYYTARSSIISLFPLLLNILMENLTLSRNPVYIRTANTTFCTIFDDQIW